MNIETDSKETHPVLEPPRIRMSLLEPKPSSKSAAPGQYLGYSLQQVRLCYHLLRVPDGDSVSLEHFDDVSIHRTDGSLLLEQSKSALAGNPISDRSVELWKSFANWAELCAANKVDASTTEFRMFVTPAKTGTLAALLNEAASEAAITGVLTKIEHLINSKDPSIGCSPYILRFLNAGDDVCRQIIEHFHLVTKQDPIEAIRSRLRATLTVDVLDDFCAAAIGMARDQIDRLIRERQKPIISASDFRRRFAAFVRKHNLSDLLHSHAPEPSREEITALVHTAPLFVRQLQAVAAKADMLMTAVGDYLRTTTDKINWADEGLIVEDSLDELDHQLERQYMITRDEVEDMLATLDERRRRRELYRKCTSTVLPLEGRVLPSHFIAGEYNCLADLLRVGWHPQYRSMFPPE